MWTGWPQTSSSMDMEAPSPVEGAVRVRVGVVVTQSPDTEDEDCLVAREETNCVDYTSGKDERKSSFSFDVVVHVDNIQRLHFEILQPLSESISCGYNGTLLIGGTLKAGKEDILIGHGIVKQVLKALFSILSSTPKGDLFTTVTFIQFYPDDSATDLLSPESQVLRAVSHPVLGHLVGGLCELPVSSAEEAYMLYERGRETLTVNAGTLTNRCSSLYTVIVERQLQPGETQDPEFCRSGLQLFDLAGGASRTNLKGVSPLVKVLDQLQSESATQNKLLHFLLRDVLTGNSRTVLLYCIQPQGLLGEETPCALALAQRVRGLVTRATHGRWCPRATEREIRDRILELRTRMMSQGERGVEDAHRLAELTQNLQVVKDQSWEKRKEKSEKIKERIQGLRPTKNLLSPGSDHSTDYNTDHSVTAERRNNLQDQLRQELKEHIKEGRGSVEGVQERVGRIQQLRESLRDEEEKQGDTSDRSEQEDWYTKAQERRRKLKEDHERVIEEEVEKMERELRQEQVEGPQRELLVLGRERQVLVLQMEALRTEAQEAERDLEAQHSRHQRELHSLREESLQVFRVFRQVCEEQKRTSEDRYRTLLLEAIQDAVYLSAQNQQLQADNKQLHKALAELKDELCVRGEPKAERSQ